MASESPEVANQALRAAEMGGGGGGGGAVAKSKSPVPTSSKTTEEEDNERPDVYDRTTRTKIDIEAFKKSVEKRMRKLFLVLVLISIPMKLCFLLQTCFHAIEKSYEKQSLILVFLFVNNAATRRGISHCE